MGAELPFWLKAYLAKDRKSTRLNSSHVSISYAVFCLKKKIDWTSLTLGHDALRLNYRHDFYCCFAYPLGKWQYSILLAISQLYISTTSCTCIPVWLYR